MTKLTAARYLGSAKILINTVVMLSRATGDLAYAYEVRKLVST